LALFREKGFAGTTMRKVAEEAGLSLDAADEALRACRSS